jgi:hypothetical protein
MEKRMWSPVRVRVRVRVMEKRMCSPNVLLIEGQTELLLN